MGCYLPWLTVLGIFCILIAVKHVQQAVSREPGQGGNNEDNSPNYCGRQRHRPRGMDNIGPPKADDTSHGNYWPGGPENEPHWIRTPLAETTVRQENVKHNNSNYPAQQPEHGTTLLFTKIVTTLAKNGTKSYSKSQNYD